MSTFFGGKNSKEILMFFRPCSDMSDPPARGRGHGNICCNFQPAIARQPDRDSQRLAVAFRLEVGDLDNFQPRLAEPRFHLAVREAKTGVMMFATQSLKPVRS